jgi:hypothetical protein
MLEVKAMGLLKIETAGAFDRHALSQVGFLTNIETH